MIFTVHTLTQLINSIHLYFANEAIRIDIVESDNAVGLKIYKNNLNNVLTEYRVDKTHKDLYKLLHAFLENYFLLIDNVEEDDDQPEGLEDLSYTLYNNDNSISDSVSATKAIEFDSGWTPPDEDEDFLLQPQLTINDVFEQTYKKKRSSTLDDYEFDTYRRRSASPPSHRG